MIRLAACFRLTASERGERKFLENSVLALKWQKDKSRDTLGFSRLDVAESLAVFCFLIFDIYYLYFISMPLSISKMIWIRNGFYFIHI